MVDSPTSADRIRSVAVLVTAITQVASAPLTPLLLGRQATTGPISDANHTAATPAGYAFSIWGLIYLASLVLAIWQLIGNAPASQANRRSGWWLVAAFAASTVWVPIFGAGLIWLAQLVIFALVGCLVVAMARLTALGSARSAAERWCLRVPVGIYLGWAICAAAAGLALTIRWFGTPVYGLDADTQVCFQCKDHAAAPVSSPPGAELSRDTPVEGATMSVGRQAFRLNPLAASRLKGLEVERFC